MVFPNWFDDSPGAEEYSRNNPYSKHYDPGYSDEESDEDRKDRRRAEADESMIYGTDEWRREYADVLVRDDDPPLPENETDFNSDDDEVFTDYMVDNYGDHSIDTPVDDEDGEYEAIGHEDDEAVNDDLDDIPF